MPQPLLACSCGQPDFRLGRCLSATLPQRPQYRAGHSSTARASVPQFLGSLWTSNLTGPPYRSSCRKSPLCRAEQRIFAIAADQPRRLYLRVMRTVSALCPRVCHSRRSPSDTSEPACTLPSTRSGAQPYLAGPPVSATCHVPTHPTSSLIPRGRETVVVGTTRTDKTLSDFCSGRKVQTLLDRFRRTSLLAQRHDLQLVVGRDVPSGLVDGRTLLQ